MHRHRGLVVVGGGEGLGLAGRDGGVLLDQLGHLAAHGLDAQGQRGDVEQQHVLDLAGQHGALDGGAHGDGFIRVDVAARLAAEQGLHHFLHLGHARLAADQDHFLDLAGLEARILQRGLARPDGLVDQLVDQGLQLGAAQLEIEMLRAGGVRRDVRQVDFGLGGGGQLDLGLLRRFLQALQGQGIALQVDALLLVELGGDVVDDPHVEIFAAEEGVAVGGEHFELVLAVDFGDLDDGDVEGAAAEVIHGDLAVALDLVHAEGQRRRGRLVDDALDVEAGDLAGVLGGLALRVVEVGGHGDDGLGDLLAQVVLGGLLHLGQDLRGDFRRGHLLALDLDPGVAVRGLGNLVGHHGDVLLHHAILEAAADQALHRVDGVGGVGHRLALGRTAGDDLAVVGVGDHGRRGALALAVLDDFGVAAFHDRHARIGGAEVDADNLRHVLSALVRVGTESNKGV